MDTGHEDAAHPVWFASTAAVAGAALWLLTRPYVGVIHDSRLYTLMAMAWAEPSRFVSDLFLEYGSQDHFSLFSPIYGFAIKHFGLTTAYPLALLASAIVWLVSAWLFLHSIFRPRTAKFAFLLLIVLPLHYGGWGGLVIGENFVTARPFAEGLIFAALASAIRQRWVTAAIVLLIALALHPLTALPGILVAALLFGTGTRARLGWFLAVGVISGAMALVLGYVGIRPFSGLWETMGGPWMQAVYARNGWIFMSKWGLNDWINLASQFAVVGLAAVYADRALQRLLQCSLLVVAAGCTVSLVGSDVFSDVLVIQVQTWRWTWLLNALASVAIVVLATTAYKQRNLIGPIGLIISAVTSYQSLISAEILLAGLALLAVSRVKPHFLVASKWLLFALSISIVIGSASLFLYVIIRHYDVLARAGMLWPELFGSSAIRIPLAIFGAILLLAADRRPRIMQALAIGLVIAAGLVWDQRTAWARYDMNGPAPTLPGKGAVIWGNDPTDTWLLLGRPAYVSAIQGAGVLFSKATALEWSRRQSVARAIAFEYARYLDQPAPLCSQVSPIVTRPEVLRICQRSPGLDGVVVDRPIDGLPAEVFSTPAQRREMCRPTVSAGLFAVHGASTFYYYKCGSD